MISLPESVLEDVDVDIDGLHRLGLLVDLDSVKSTVPLVVLVSLTLVDDLLFILLNLEFPSFSLQSCCFLMMVVHLSVGLTKFGEILVSRLPVPLSDDPWLTAYGSAWWLVLPGLVVEFDVGIQSPDLRIADTNEDKPDILE